MTQADRIDASIALQLWQRFFLPALAAHLVSNDESNWAKHRLSALEYLARGLMIENMGAFFDGINSGVFRAACEGVSRVREDVPALVDEIETTLRDIEKLMLSRASDLVDQQGAEALRRELKRIPEMRGEHRAWYGTPEAPQDEQPSAFAPGAFKPAETPRETTNDFAPTQQPAQGEQPSAFAPGAFQPGEAPRQDNTPQTADAAVSPFYKQSSVNREEGFYRQAPARGPNQGPKRDAPAAEASAAAPTEPAQTQPTESENPGFARGFFRGAE